MGVSAPFSATELARPSQHDGYLVPDFDPNYPIDSLTYLPGGKPDRRNSLRNTNGNGLSSFSFLELEADMSGLVGGTAQTVVYVPCYWGDAVPQQSLQLTAYREELQVSGTSMVEGGDPLVLSIRLNEQPVNNVTVSFSHTFGFQAQSVSWSGTNVLTSSNWSTGVTLVINLVDDNVEEPNQNVSITFTGSGTNATVTGVTVSVTIFDNDGGFQPPEP